MSGGSSSLNARAHPRRLGVLFLHTATTAPLGADTWVQAQIVRGIDKATHRVHVACAFGPTGRPTPTYVVMSDIEGIQLVRTDLGRERSEYSIAPRTRTLLGAFVAVRSIFALIRYVRVHDIQIIHTTDRPRDAAVTVLLSRLTRARSIVHAHVGFDASWMSKLLTMSIKRADALIGVSEYVCRTLTEAGNRPARVFAVLNAIDVSRWVPGVGRLAARAEFGFQDDDIVVISACRLFPSKGPSELIRALAIARRHCPQLRLLLVGREVAPGYLAELRGLVRDLGVEPFVTFAGQRDDIPALMAGAEIFAMPSLGEPFGLVFLEAMAMQLPVIALGSGGTSEVVINDETGLLSPPHDEASLAKNLERCAADATLRARLGTSGRKRVEVDFAWYNPARQTEAVYQVVSDKHFPVRWA
jgi:glycosyltransferase involved in cell wall biosynthesis